jgi:hypothetical protein
MSGNSPEKTVFAHADFAGIPVKITNSEKQPKNETT